MMLVHMFLPSFINKKKTKYQYSNVRFSQTIDAIIAQQTRPVHQIYLIVVIVHDLCNFYHFELSIERNNESDLIPPQPEYYNIEDKLRLM